MKRSFWISVCLIASINSAVALIPEVVWTQSYNSGRFVNVRKILLDDSGGFLLAVTENETSAFATSRSTLFKANSQGQLIWEYNPTTSEGYAYRGTDVVHDPVSGGYIFINTRENMEPGYISGQVHRVQTNGSGSRITTLNDDSRTFCPRMLIRQSNDYPYLFAFTKGNLDPMPGVDDNWYVFQRSNPSVSFSFVINVDSGTDEFMRDSSLNGTTLYITGTRNTYDGNPIGFISRKTDDGGHLWLQYLEPNFQSYAVLSLSDGQGAIVAGVSHDRTSGHISRYSDAGILLWHTTQPGAEFHALTERPGGTIIAGGSRDGRLILLEYSLDGTLIDEHPSLQIGTITSVAAQSETALLVAGVFRENQESHYATVFASLMESSIEIELIPAFTPLTVPAAGGLLPVTVQLHLSQVEPGPATFWSQATHIDGFTLFSVELPVELIPNGTMELDEFEYLIPDFAPEGSWYLNTELIIPGNPDAIRDSLAFTKEEDDLAVKNLNLSELPDIAELLGPYPNPFNSSTTVTLRLPYADFATLNAIDIQGRLVQSITGSGQLLPPGEHKFTVGAEDLSSGVYFVQVDLAGQTFIEPRKLVVVK
jgi:Secretion system C-terminal sorting domain